MSLSSKVRSIFNNKGAVDNLTDLHNKYVVVQADKASNNIVFVCKTLYIDCLVKELGINNNTGNLTSTSLSKEEILSNHKSVISSSVLSIKDDYVDLPSLYRIPKIHKCPYKEMYIAGSVKCFTRSLSKLLTTLLSTVKDGLQTYCDTACSRNGIIQMWILKNSTDLVESLSSQSLSGITSINTFDFQLSIPLYHILSLNHDSTVNYPFLDSNIPSSPAYGVYMWQLIRYSRTCNSYQDFLHRSILLTRKLLSQGFIKTRLRSTVTII